MIAIFAALQATLLPIPLYSYLWVAFETLFSCAATTFQRAQQRQ